MSETSVERQTMSADIVCVGFGPATGGFLTALSKELQGESPLQSQAAPGLPLQVLCYERADDIGFGVSGVVSRARAIKESFPEIDWSQIPLAAGVKQEKVAYLLDPAGASRRSAGLRFIDKALRTFPKLAKLQHEAFELPYIPPFLQKHGGAVFSAGQFNQWTGMQLMSSGLVQIWPGTPVSEPIVEEGKVAGVRLADQGLEKNGTPTESFMPGMDIRAQLTVVGDGPVGAVGRQLDEQFGMPPGHEKHEWAVGMKAVVALREDLQLEPGTVFHTFGYPEPEIFGFMYIYPGNIASCGIFVPSWFGNPVRTSYRYLQHWMLHPYLWRYLEGGTLRSWGAKSLLESGKRGEPYLCGDGYARIGEGSGTTNVLTGSGVDEAWKSGQLLAEAVIELARAGKEFSKENLEQTYVARRRASWLESEAKVAERSRDGFGFGVIAGLVGMGLAGLTKGILHMPGRPKPAYQQLESFGEFFKGKLDEQRIKRIRQDCKQNGKPLHDALMDACGWPAIPHDGKLLMSQQDALLIGGKVQAAPGYADHVVFLHPELCRNCGTQICIDICSGQAITPGEDGTPAFDREKCVHCGACVWNCSEPIADGSQKTNIEFRAGSGGLHSAEN